MNCDTSVAFSTSKNANLIFRISIMRHVEGRLESWGSVLSSLLHDPIFSKEISRKKAITIMGLQCKNKLSLGTTATLDKILIFSKTEQSLYVVLQKHPPWHEKSIYKTMLRTEAYIDLREIKSSQKS